MPQSQCRRAATGILCPRVQDLWERHDVKDGRGEETWGENRYMYMHG